MQTHKMLATNLYITFIQITQNSHSQFGRVRPPGEPFRMRRRGRISQAFAGTPRKSTRLLIAAALAHREYQMVLPRQPSYGSAGTGRSEASAQTCWIIQPQGSVDGAWATAGPTVRSAHCAVATKKAGILPSNASARVRKALSSCGRSRGSLRLSWPSERNSCKIRRLLP